MLNKINHNIVEIESWKMILKYFLISINSLFIFIKPSAIFILICVFAIIVDSYSAFRLSKRLKNKYKTKKISGKFESNKVFMCFDKLLIILLVIMLSFLVDTFILTSNNLFLSKSIAGIFCLMEIWSILENESSCNDNRWAKVLQKIFIDKTSRHLDINPDYFKDLEKKEEEENNK